MTTKAQPSNVRFLLVEDDDDHAELVLRAMRSQRIVNDVARVADGRSAVDYLRRAPPFESAPRPDIILLDLKLPVLDGHEVLERIKSDPELRLIPVVVLTTSIAEADRARAYGLNANSYIVKPVAFEQFHQMVIDLGLYWSVWNHTI